MIDFNKYKNTIIAHRGIHDNKHIPENSLKAFKIATDKNLPIELDIHLSKDNQLVVFHDNNLKRMTNVSSLIEDLTLEEIKKFNLLNTKEKIPTLEEVLNLVNGKVLIDIEIKVKRKIKQLIKILLDTLNDYEGQIIIKSFNPIAVKKVKKHSKKYHVGLLMDCYAKNKLFNIFSKTNIIISYCKPDFLSINKKMINKKNIQKNRNKLPILIWTIKKQEEIDKINNKNFIYICNNLPYEKK